MSDDLQARILIDVMAAIQNLNRLKAVYEKNEKAARDSGQAGESAHKRVAAAANAAIAKERELAAAAAKTRKQWTDSANVLGRMGGPVGELGGKLVGAGGLSGKFALLGGAAAAAGLVIRGVMAASARAVDDAGRSMDQAQSRFDRFKSARMSASQSAAGGLDEAALMRRLAAEGIDESHVEYMAKEERASFEDAAQALIATRGNSVRAKVALKAARTGIVDAAEAGRITMGMRDDEMVDNYGSSAARVLGIAGGDFTGMVDYDRNRNKVARAEQFAMSSRLGAQDYFRTTMRDDTRRILRGRAAAGEGRAAILDERFRTLHPEEQAELDAMDEDRRAADVAEARMRAESPFVAAARDTGALIGVSDGSERAQYHRLIEQQAQTNRLLERMINGARK